MIEDFKIGEEGLSNKSESDFSISRVLEGKSPSFIATAESIFNSGIDAGNPELLIQVLQREDVLEIIRKTNDEISAMDQSDTRKLIVEKPKIIKRAVQSINTIIDEII